jgi:hypothetical protein
MIPDLWPGLENERGELRVAAMDRGSTRLRTCDIKVYAMSVEVILTQPGSTTQNEMDSAASKPGRLSARAAARITKELHNAKQVIVDQSDVIAIQRAEIDELKSIMCAVEAGRLELNDPDAAISPARLRAIINTNHAWTSRALALVHGSSEARHAHDAAGVMYCGQCYRENVVGQHLEVVYTTNGSVRVWCCLHARLVGDFTYTAPPTDHR